MRRFRVLFAFVLGSAMFPFGAAPVLRANQPVLTVPGDFPTIQQAVDAAAPGDTVQVAAGIYCENVLVTKSDLRLRASGGGTAIVSGACAPRPTGYGIYVMGSAAAPVSNVDISGFVVEHFTVGIGMRSAVRSRVHLNETRDNTAGTAGHGILLIASSFNEVSENTAYGNGHLGIGLNAGSNGNLIRANRLHDNQTFFASPGGVCSLMLWGSPVNTDNQIVENDVADTIGSGIMIGPGGAQANNLVAQNRVSGHPWEGILIMPGSMGNIVQQNDARGNGTSGLTPDLGDYSGNATNIWQRNLGTCEPGNAGCE